ncbi:putative membrane protein, partial [Vibrio parahaemolyticus V-223/04]
AWRVVIWICRSRPSLLAQVWLPPSRSTQLAAWYLVWAQVCFLALPLAC